MSLSGGGDIGEVLLRLGREALEHEGERAGLSPRAGRMRCPWSGCEHKGAERGRDAVIFAAKHPRVHCYACSTSGDLVDLLQRTRGFSREEALAHVRGVPVPERPRPELRVVGSKPPEREGKMEPADVRRLWDSMVLEHPSGRSYLSTRKLDDAIEAGLVRFATPDNKDKRISGRAKQGYVVGALLTDVVGNARGLQLRLARNRLNNDEATIVTVKGSDSSRAFFGNPELIESAPVVAVAEGLADTLALQLWAEGVVCVGAAGKGALPNLAVELEGAGIDVTGKLFVLFPQNDRPDNASRAAFTRLKQLLQARGARVCWEYTPDEFEDLARWRQSKPDALWPPAELARAYGNEPGDDAPRTTILPEGLAVPLPTQVTAERFANDFTTLCALLDDPSQREAVMGRGELTWCEMTTRVRWGDRHLTEHDLSTIRLGLERVARSTDGKPLKFTETDIEKALSILARRKPVHAVREWLGAQRWDGKERLEVELPVILGHESGSFAARLLRRWFVSTVARAYEPGSKADTVLILTGAQGERKSTFFETLAGKWFTDSRVEIGDKDGLLIMREAWVVEWAELESINRSRSNEATKAFLSARVDLFRRPYGREVQRAPRHCVFVGTSNKDEMFSDTTGNRRFWPVKVQVKRIDLAWLRKHREQLFAEAVQLYASGKTCADCAKAGERCSEHRWWLTDEEETQLAALNEQFRTAPHPWTHRIIDHLEEHGLVDTFTIDQIMRGALDMRVQDFHGNDSKIIGDILRELGWKPDRVYESGGWRRVWRRPEVTP